jgi:D-alanyl-lipoteichoic acid acyltransferase DltB (MBOAT superfamily)
MIFHSLDFLVFFAVVVTIYWQLSHRGQNLFLLAASYVFYGWVHPWFVILMLASTTVDYWAGQRMEDDPSRKKVYLYASLLVNLGMLGVFKYYNFFVENVRGVLASVGLTVSPPILELVLPAGISFYTFQALSYTVEVYWGHMRARRNAVAFALFVAFFPHLVAGPIMRAMNLLVQVEQPRTWSTNRARDAVPLIVWGFFKKLVIADNVGLIANRVFTHEDPSFEMLWAGVFAFGLQIYADFSAYSDIARGTARWLGFELMVNFDQPYLARGPRDFWSRWHISLSTWFRDYVYIPLGGSRLGFPRELGNIMTTFLISGLWHGANWNYVLWGGYHGLLLVASRLVSRAFPRPGPHLARALVPLRVAATFMLVHIGWLMFRETDTQMLLRDLTLSPWTGSALDWKAGLALVLMLVPFAAPLYLQGLIVEWWRGRREPFAWGPARPPARVAWLAAQGVLVGVLFTGILLFRSRASLDFIHFQF